MIFQLKDPIQEKVKKEENLWKKKFAWFPVKTKNNQLVWLEDVYTIKEEKQIIVNKNVYVTNVQFFMQKHAGIISLNGIEKINKIDHSELFPVEKKEENLIPIELIDIIKEIKFNEKFKKTDT